MREQSYGRDGEPKGLTCSTSSNPNEQINAIKPGLSTNREVTSAT